MLVCLASLMMRLSHRQSRLQFQTRLLSGHADEIFSSFLHLACAFPYLLASYLEFDRGLLCLLQVNSRLKLDLPGARPAPASRSRPQVRANSRKRLPAPALTPPHAVSIGVAICRTMQGKNDEQVARRSLRVGGAASGGSQMASRGWRNGCGATGS